MRVGIPHIYNPKLNVGVIVPRVNWHPKPKSQRLSLWDDLQANLVPASSPKVSFMRPAPQYTCQSRPVFSEPVSLIAIPPTMEPPSSRSVATDI